MHCIRSGRLNGLRCNLHKEVELSKMKQQQHHIRCTRKLALALVLVQFACLLGISSNTKVRKFNRRHIMFAMAPHLPHSSKPPKQKGNNNEWHLDKMIINAFESTKQCRMHDNNVFTMHKHSHAHTSSFRPFLVHWLNWLTHTPHSLSRFRFAISKSITSYMLCT